MALTQYYVDPAINANSGTGTIGDPFGDLQYGLNTVTRDSTNGDQFNVKAGTAEVLASSLTLATYGTPANNAPLVLRGYTSTANDGGVGEINGNNATMFTTTYNDLILSDLKLHDMGTNDAVLVGQRCIVDNCEVYRGSSVPAGYKFLIRVGADSAVTRCYVYDAGTNGRGIQVGNSAYAGWCHVRNCSNIGIEVGSTSMAAASWNIVRGPVDFGINAAGKGSVVLNNIVYGAGGGGTGIRNQGDTWMNITVCANNMVSGFSGAGGIGISAAYCRMVGYNGFYNNTTHKSLSVYVDRTSADVLLGADPFTDAANGDFSLTDAAKAVLRSAGWPASYLGAHANTDPHVTIGPMQYGPAVAGGGAVRILPARGRLG